MRRRGAERKRGDRDRICSDQQAWPRSGVSESARPINRRAQSAPSFLPSLLLPTLRPDSIRCCIGGFGFARGGRNTLRRHKAALRDDVSDPLAPPVACSDCNRQLERMTVARCEAERARNGSRAPFARCSGSTSVPLRWCWSQRFCRTSARRCCPPRRSRRVNGPGASVAALHAPPPAAASPGRLPNGRRRVGPRGAHTAPHADSRSGRAGSTRRDRRGR